jgi:hypothetical protein
MRTVKIFLASSAELDSDKEKFELFISKKNKVLKHKRIFLELTTWKDFVSAITEEHSQEKYNNYIQSCDISIFLFHTRLGRFTKEEFDTAHQAFISCKSRIKTPLIYTFFKICKEEGTEISEFKRYIDKLDHFYDTYESLDDLLGNFSNQLDKLEIEEVLLVPEKIDIPKILKYTVYYILIPFLVLSGAFFSYYFFQPIEMTVKINEVRSIPNLPFKEGSITLTYGDKTEKLTIKDEVIFKQIPSKYRRREAKLYFQAMGYNNLDTLIKVQRIIELPIERNNSLSFLYGVVLDHITQSPIEGVTVKIDELVTKTDINGIFRIIIPRKKQALYQRLELIKKEYRKFDDLVAINNRELRIHLIK